MSVDEDSCVSQRRFGRVSRELIRRGEPIQMEGSDVATNGWIARLEAVRRFAKEPGGVALLVVMILFGFETGWIPSRLSRIDAKVDVHQTTLDRAIATRTQKDDRLAEILNRLVAEIEKQNKRDRIRECAEIQDRELRQKCLE